MLDIEYKGANCFIISTKKTTAVFDPKVSQFGLKDVLIDGSVEIATESRFALNNPKSKIRIEGPGDYEVGDLSIHGIGAVRHIDGNTSEELSTIYRIVVEGGGRLAILGNVSSSLNDNQLEELGVVDILVIPIGGNGYTIDSTAATSLTRQISPKVVIPIHYADNGVKYEVPQDSIDLFIKEMDVNVEETLKYKIKNNTLPESITIVKVQRS